MSAKCQKIIEILERLAPRSLAESWDNVGLMVGKPSMEVKKVMICLDVDEAAVEEAKSQGVDLIVSHHPFIFKPLNSLRWDNKRGELIRELVVSNIGVYSAHTNLDKSSRGLNRWLADKLKLEKIRVLDKLNSEKLYKFVIYVPKSDIGIVKEELGKQGAGWIGNYSNCSFYTEGIGSFKPLEEANPYIGTPGKIESVEEARLETVIREKDLSRTVKAVLKVHPYEEPAYDIYRLENEGLVEGYGYIGVIDEKLSGDDFIRYVKSKLNVDQLRGSKNLPQAIKKVAVCSGAGANLINKAKFHGADVLVTGDVKYHDYQTAEEIGLFVLDAGHYHTEILVVDFLSDYLVEEFRKEKIDVAVIRSRSNQDYIQSY